MDTRSELQATVKAMVQPGKGLLAADESGPTIAKRFKTIGLDRPRKIAARIAICCSARRDSANS